MSKELNYMQKYLVEEFIEEYSEGRISRHEMRRRILAVTGSIVATATLLSACRVDGPVSTPAQPNANAGSTPEHTGSLSSSPSQAAGATATSATTPSATSGISIPEDDPAIQVTTASIDRSSYTLTGYLARPRGTASVPGVIVVHENRGLTSYIKDVARRAAKAGYAALAPDLVSSKGGSAKYSDTNQITGILGQANPDELTDDLNEAATYLQAQPFVTPGGIGTVGFCLGGGYVWRLAMANQNIKAAVPFYGPVPQDPAPLAKSNAAFLIILAGNDTRVNSTIPAAETVLKANNKIYEVKTYEGANHAFHNDTGASYKPDAAKDAWAQTIAWFNKYLKNA